MKNHQNKLLGKIDLDTFIKKTENIKKTHNLSEEDAEKFLMDLGPKKLKSIGCLENDISWRAGYTKPTIAKRRSTNRKKNKLARIARRKNR